jgi:hypothetical protein
MNTPSDSPAKDDIARVAYAIWEAEGRPEGCDHEHWMRAKTVIEEGRAEVEFPESAAPGDQDDRAPRPVQPGFQEAAPGMVPSMKANSGLDLREEPGGRFAKQLAEAPEGSSDDLTGQVETPGPRNPPPEPPTNADGYVAIPSVEDAAGRAIADDPQPPPETGDGQSRRRAKGTPNLAAV